MIEIWLEININASDHSVLGPVVCFFLGKIFVLDDDPAVRPTKATVCRRIQSQHSRDAIANFAKRLRR